jgi:hypothetical protein
MNQLSNLVVQSILTNQNLLISAVSAVASTLCQQNLGTNDDIETSKNDINDTNTINNDLLNQQEDLLLPSISIAVNVLGIVPQA